MGRLITNQNGMPENMFRNLLDNLSILVQNVEPFDFIDERDLVRVVFETITEEPYRSWCEQWRKGDYPVYLLSGEINGKDTDDLDAQPRD